MEIPPKQISTSATSKKTTNFIVETQHPLDIKTSNIIKDDERATFIKIQIQIQISTNPNFSRSNKQKTLSFPAWSCREMSDQRLCCELHFKMLAHIYYFSEVLHWKCRRKELQMSVFWKAKKVPDQVNFGDKWWMGNQFVSTSTIEQRWKLRPNGILRCHKWRKQFSECLSCRGTLTALYFSSLTKSTSSAGKSLPKDSSLCTNSSSKCYMNSNSS